MVNEVLGNQRRKKKPGVTNETFDFRNERRELKRQKKESVGSEKIQSDKQKDAKGDEASKVELDRKSLSSYRDMPK